MMFLHEQNEPNYFDWENLWPLSMVFKPFFPSREGKIWGTEERGLRNRPVMARELVGEAWSFQTELL